jgi:hypothetical protein
LGWLRSCAAHPFCEAAKPFFKFDGVSEEKQYEKNIKQNKKNYKYLIKN